MLFCSYCRFVFFFFFKQKTAYEMRISAWSSDVCSSDLNAHVDKGVEGQPFGLDAGQLGRLDIAAERIDTAADHRAVGDEAVEHDQGEHDDQNVRQAAIDRKSVV